MPNFNILRWAHTLAGMQGEWVVWLHMVVRFAPSAPSPELRQRAANCGRILPGWRKMFQHDFLMNFEPSFYKSILQEPEEVLTILTICQLLYCECGLSYTSQIKRLVIIRNIEHISHVNHRRLIKSVVCDHILNKSNFNISFDTPQVLANEHRYIPRTIHEASIKKMIWCYHMLVAVRLGLFSDHEWCKVLKTSGKGKIKMMMISIRKFAYMV